MNKDHSKMLSGILACALCVTAVLTNSAAVFADSNLFETESVSGGYAITGVKEGAIESGTVTIPDEISGTSVLQLGSTNQAYTFLGRNEVTKLVIGKNAKSVTTYAFYGARSLEEIEINSGNTALHFDTNDNILYGGTILIKYLSTTPERDYTVPGNFTRIFNMDYTTFGTLDLNKVTQIEKLTLAGAEIDTLIINDIVVGTSYDILYGASVKEFNATGSTIYESDGKALWHDGRLIKVAQGASFEDGYFERFTSISPHAFNSIAEYKNLIDILPEGLTENVVFSFFTHDEGVFMVNNEVSFCYNYDKQVPTTVGDVTEYSADIDAQKYEQIKALMYAGVPFDGTGLFESVFGESYDEISNDPDIMAHGDAALNAVSAMIYKTLENKMPAEIRGIGYGPFTEENVNEYILKLQAAVNNYEKYNFTPDFSIKDHLINFHEENGKYVSDPVQVDTLDGSGDVNNDYIYTIYITTPGITVDGGEDNFKTGTKVVLVSETKPANIAISYSEPSLKYYQRTSNDVQNVLVSASKQQAYKLDVVIAVDAIPFSKVDATTSKELPGAILVLSDEAGVLVEEWVSGITPHLITGLEDGMYTWTEITAPDGYEIAESIIFEIKDGKVNGEPLVMKDEPKKATPSDATPSEPDDATPSEPDIPDVPIYPDTPNEPETTPSKPSSGGSGGGSGSSSSGGFSSGGPGTTPTQEAISETLPEVETVPEPITEPIATLPKTNDLAAASLISLAALLTLAMVNKRRRT